MERWESLPLGKAVRMGHRPSSPACGPALSQELLPPVEELVCSVAVANKTLEIAYFEKSQETLATTALVCVRV